MASWAWLGFLLHSFTSLAAACNGDASFCSLPLTMFTFAGTHNSGSFNLNIPEVIKDDIPLIDINSILSCFYDVHHMNYLEQLNFGIRFFFPDVCTRASGFAGVFYDCHSSSGTNEEGLGWGTIFGDNLDVMKDWLSLHTRELLMVAPDNMHADLANPNQDWFDLFGSKFGGSCFVIDSTTVLADLPTKSETSCARIAGRPIDNITMGELIDRNLRVLVLGTTDTFTVIKSTYDPVVNAGAKSADLLKQFEDYSRGIIPLAPQSLLKLTVYGSARAPDFSQVDMSRPDDPIWPVVAVGSELGNTDLRCVERQATSYNTDLLQDDSHPHTYFADKECPDSPCGCLGYQSPLEPIHQRLLDQGHQVMVVTNDYSELGEKQHVAQVTRRMNFANLRRWTSAPEPVKTWYDCNWKMVVAIVAPSFILFCCCFYWTIVWLFPKSHGKWARTAWMQRQDLHARKRIARERGREEAQAYLRNAQGGGLTPTTPEAQSVGANWVTGVAPVAAAPINNNPHGFYQAKDTE